MKPVAVGTVVPLALYQDWGRRMPRWLLHLCAWVGAGLLVLRGVAGLADALLRESGLARNGLTGLTYEQVTGDADPSAYSVWSGAAIDANFLLGGVLFGICALGFRRLGRQGTVAAAKREAANRSA